MVVLVLLVVGLVAVFWIRAKGEIPNSMSYQLFSDGRICELGNARGSFDLIRKEGSIAVPYWGMETNGTAILYVEDDVTAEVMVEAFGFFAEKAVPSNVLRRRNEVEGESFAYVVPLMGLGANGPIRQAMDQAKEGHLDAGGEIGLDDYTLLSVELMDDRMFFGNQRMPDEVIRNKLRSASVSAVVVRFREGSNLLGLWKIVRYNERDLEIIPFGRPSKRREMNLPADQSR